MGFIRPANPLVYPGSTRAGFNPNHLAVGKGIVRYSGVAAGANFANLLTAKVPTINGTITATIDGTLGRTMTNTTASSYLSCPGVNDTSPGAVTFGGIVTPIGLAALFGVMFSNNNGSGTNADTWFYFTSGAIVPTLFVQGGGVQAGITLTAGVPYFIVMSTQGTILNSLVLNLRTGNVLTTSSSISKTIGTPTASTYNIGGTAGASNRYMNASLAAIMYSVNNFLSIPQLQAWAAAPWDFWYPPAAPWFSALRSPGGTVAVRPQVFVAT